MQFITRAAFLALAAAAFADACAQVSLKASAPRGLSYGGKFRVKATLRSTARGTTPGAGLYLGVQLPTGVGYAGTSKSLPNQPVVWGLAAQNLYWRLPTLNKKSYSFTMNLNVTSCVSSSQTITLPVSIFELDGQGNQICVQSKSLQVRRKDGRTPPQTN